MCASQSGGADAKVAGFAGQGNPAGFQARVVFTSPAWALHCGLGRFSLHLCEGIPADFRDRIEPVFLLPQSTRPRFTEREFGTVAVRLWRKGFVQRWGRPIAKPFLGRPPYAVWHMTNQMSRDEPLDPRVPHARDRRQHAGGVR